MDPIKKEIFVGLSTSSNGADKQKISSGAKVDAEDSPSRAGSGQGVARLHTPSVKMDAPRNSSPSRAASGRGVARPHTPSVKMQLTDAHWFSSGFEGDVPWNFHKFLLNS